MLGMLPEAFRTVTKTKYGGKMQVFGVKAKFIFMAERIALIS